MASVIVDIGDTVKSTITFTLSGVPSDPDLITFYLLDPDDVELVGNYPSDPGDDLTIDQDAEGNYSTQWPIDQSGIFHHRWEGTWADGTTEADEDYLRAVASKFYPRPGS